MVSSLLSNDTSLTDTTQRQKMGFVERLQMVTVERARRGAAPMAGGAEADRLGGVARIRPPVIVGREHIGDRRRRLSHETPQNAKGSDTSGNLGGGLPKFPEGSDPGGWMARAFGQSLPKRSRV